MKVKTIKVGFINGSIVEPDTVLDIPEKAFSKNWMESLEPAAKPAKLPKGKDPAEPAESATI